MPLTPRLLSSVAVIVGGLSSAPAGIRRTCGPTAMVPPAGPIVWVVEAAGSAEHCRRPTGRSRSPISDASGAGTVVGAVGARSLQEAITQTTKATIRKRMAFMCTPILLEGAGSSFGDLGTGKNVLKRLGFRRDCGHNVATLRRCSRDRSVTSMRHHTLGFFVLVFAGFTIFADSVAAQTDTAWVRTDTLIPMRDGIRLFTVISVPSGPGLGGPLPILMTRTPYEASGNAGMARRANELGLGGYILVFQDIRGRFRSEGTFDMNRPPRSGHAGTDESTDTYDTIDWLVKHVPNNNGRNAGD